MIMEKVEDAVMQHNKKMTWLSDEENRENRSHSPPSFYKIMFSPVLRSRATLPWLRLLFLASEKRNDLKMLIFHFIPYLPTYFCIIMDRLQIKF